MRILRSVNGGDGHFERSLNESEEVFIYSCKVFRFGVTTTATPLIIWEQMKTKLKRSSLF